MPRPPMPAPLVVRLRIKTAANCFLFYKWEVIWCKFLRFLRVYLSFVAQLLLWFFIFFFTFIYFKIVLKGKKNFNCNLKVKRS